MNILIAVPTFENIYPDTYKSIYDMDKAGNETEFEFVRGYDVATARNKIARLALERGTDYVLMVDNDVVLPWDALINLTDDLREVCIGYYAHRDANNRFNGNTNICRIYDEKGQRYFNYPLESEYTAGEMKKMREAGEYKVQVHGGGMGCALIKTDVFRRLKFPYFDWVHYKSGRMLGEDLYFCELCKKAKIPIYTDTRVGCGHLFRYIQNVKGEEDADYDLR